MVKAKKSIDHRSQLALIGASAGLVLIAFAILRTTNSPYNNSSPNDLIIMASVGETSVENSQAASITKQIVETEEIPFETEFQVDKTLRKGQTKIKVAGVNGEQKSIYRIVITGEQEVERKLISRQIIKQPVKKIVIVGDKATANNLTNQNKPSPNQNHNPTPPTTSAPTSNSHFNQTEAQRMLEPVNARRREAGVGELYYNPTLAELAKIRAREIVILFDHTRPSGQPWYTINPSLVNGENLIKSNHANTAEAAVDSWMLSPGHRDNILRPEFRSVGGSMLYDDSSPEGFRYYWVQLFSVQ